MFILSTGDILRAGAGQSRTPEEIRRQQELVNAKKTDKKSSDAKVSEEQNTKSTPPPQQLTAAQIYHNALIKTLDAAKNVASSHAELQFEEGRVAAKKEGANLSEKQASNIETASSITKGRTPGVNIHVGQQIAAEIKSNPKFKSLDQDALDVAAKVVEAFMGGLV